MNLDFFMASRAVDSADFVHVPRTVECMPISLTIVDFNMCVSVLFSEFYDCYDVRRICLFSFHLNYYLFCRLLMRAVSDAIQFVIPVSVMCVFSYAVFAALTPIHPSIQSATYSRCGMWGFSSLTPLTWCWCMCVWACTLAREKKVRRRWWHGSLSSTSERNLFYMRNRKFGVCFFAFLCSFSICI